jgi:hypothetical protein
MNECGVHEPTLGWSCALTMRGSVPTRPHFVLEANGKMRKNVNIVRVAPHLGGMMMSITVHTTIGRTGDILYAPVGTEEAVMMSVIGGCYFGLNAVGMRIWELLEHPRMIAELCAQLCEEFEVEAEACEVDVLKFVNELIANGIVHEAAA